MALRVQGHIDGKISHFDLLAGRSQRPLVWQEHRSVGLQSRQGVKQHSWVGRGFFGDGCRDNGYRGKKQQGT